LAGGAIIGFVAGVADPLNFGAAARAGSFVAAVDSHAFAEGGDFFWKFAARFDTEEISPLCEAGSNGFEKALDLWDGELLRERERREFGFPENFVGVGVANAAEEAGISEGALESVIGGEKRGGELFGSGAEDFEAAGVERPETVFAADNVKRGTLFGSGFGPEERAVGKIERGQTARRRNFDAAGLCSKGVPVKAACDHQVKHKPKVVFEADADTLSDAAKLEDFLAGSVGQGRSCGAQQKRADDSHGFECLAEYAGFESFDVDGDVGEFGHAVSTLVSQLGAGNILQRLKKAWMGVGGCKRRTVRSGCATSRTVPKGLMVRCEAYNRLWRSEKIGGDWPKGQRKFFVETRQEKLHIQK